MENVFCIPMICEELLLIILVIPEKIKFFQSDLGRLRMRGAQRACAWFLTYFYMYLSLFFTECRLKFLSSLAKPKHVAPTQIPSFSIIILASMPKFCIEIPIEKLEKYGTVS